VARKGRSKPRGASPPPLKAPNIDYPDDAGNVLTLRGALSPATRRQYAETATGNPLSQEDAWHRALEFLFERLAVQWTISGVPVQRQRDLLLRFRAATREERDWVRSVIRTHCSEYFPDVQAP
jgi:hypothetical protein